MSTLPASAAADSPADAGDRIGELRSAIDACDAEIIELVERRLAISREIGALRAASPSRERSVRCAPRAGAPGSRSPASSRCWPASVTRSARTAPRSA